MADNEIETSGFVQISRALRENTSIRILSLESTFYINGTRDHENIGIQTLAEALSKNSTLTCLCLRSIVVFVITYDLDNNIDKAALEFLVDGLQFNTSIKKLDLSGKNMLT